MFRIYLVTNNINGKVYVGKTSKTIEERWYEHSKNRINASVCKTYFYKALKKHGLSNFTIKEIDCTENESAANELESKYILEYKSYLPEFGYNSTMGGDGVVPTDVTRNKISSALTGIIRSDQTKIKIGLASKGRPSPMKGKTHSKETRQKISDIQKLILPLTEIAQEYADGFSIPVIANKYGVAPMTIWKRLKEMGVQTRKSWCRFNPAGFLGHHHTEESKRKIGNASRNRTTKVHLEETNGAGVDM